MDAIIKTRLVRAGYKPLSKTLISGGYRRENNYSHCGNMLTMRHAGKKERKRKWREKAREVHTIKEITLSESRKAKERQNGGLWPPITPTVSQ